MTGAGRIQFAEPDKVYAPGDILRGCVEIPWETTENCESIEVSCLWYTVGKGEEDLGVLSFSRIDGRREARSGPSWRRDFEIELPPSPVSYVGVLVSIIWCVRLRLFPMGSKPIVLEQPFTLVGCKAPYLDVLSRGPIPPVPPASEESSVSE